MTTAPITPLRVESGVGRVQAWLDGALDARQARAVARRALLVGVLRLVAPWVLSVAAMAAFTTAGFLFSTPVGFAVLGVCLLLADRMVAGGPG